MTYLVRLKSGVYYFRKIQTLPSGKRRETRRSLKTTDHKLAQYLALKHHFGEPPLQQPIAIISEQSNGVVVGAIVSKGANQLLLKNAIYQYLSEKERSKYWTLREYRRGEVMLQALAKLLGKLEVRSVGRKDANAFKESLLASARSITTVNNYLKRAAMLFDWLIQRGDCSENVFRGQNVKQRRHVSTERKAFSVDDKTTYFRFAQDQEEWRKWILLLLRYTGARPSEICQLYKDDINIRAKVIDIRATRPDQTLKTMSSERSIPIHSQLLKAGLLEFIESVHHPRLFPQLNHVKSGGYSHTFVTWYSKARTKTLEHELVLPGLYGTRHTAATEMKNAGIPTQFAAAVFGHSNDSITYDRYGKGVELKNLANAVEAIAREEQQSNQRTTEGEVQ